MRKIELFDFSPTAREVLKQLLATSQKNQKSYVCGRICCLAKAFHTPQLPVSDNYLRVLLKEFQEKDIIQSKCIKCGIYRIYKIEIKFQI